MTEETTDQRMQRFAQEHQQQCGSDTEIIIFRADQRPGGRIPGETDWLEPWCPHCGVFSGIRVDPAELVCDQINADGTPVFHLVDPA